MKTSAIMFVLWVYHTSLVLLTLSPTIFYTLDWMSIIKSVQATLLRQMWRAENRQSVQRQTVRNTTTKDSAETLPLNCYESKGRDSKLVGSGSKTNYCSWPRDHSYPCHHIRGPHFGGYTCLCQWKLPSSSAAITYYLASFNKNTIAKTMFFTQDPIFPCRFVETSAILFVYAILAYTMNHMFVTMAAFAVMVGLQIWSSR